MSGKPNPNQAGELRQCAAMVREMDNQIGELQTTIEDAKKKLEQCSTCRNRNAKRVVELLNLMDCAGSGNFGWEQRIAWLLAEVVAQAEQHGKQSA